MRRANRESPSEGSSIPAASSLTAGGHRQRESSVSVFLRCSPLSVPCRMRHRQTCLFPKVSFAQAAIESIRRVGAAVPTADMTRYVRGERRKLSALPGKKTLPHPSALPDGKRHGGTIGLDEVHRSRWSRVSADRRRQAARVLHHGQKIGRAHLGRSNQGLRGLLVRRLARPLSQLLAGLLRTPRQRRPGQDVLAEETGAGGPENARISLRKRKLLRHRIARFARRLPPPQPRLWMARLKRSEHRGDPAEEGGDEAGHLAVRLLRPESDQRLRDQRAR